LLDEISLKGAKGVLINITGGHDLTLFELDEAANRIREEVDPDANIIVGSTLDTEMGGLMRVSVVATGIDAVDVNTETPLPRRSMSEPLKPMSRPEPEPAIDEPEEVAARVAEAEEPSLFSDFDEQEPAARASDAVAEDDLPPPAYQPQVAAFEPRREELMTAAPKVEERRAPGTPSPEALARLRTAVQKQPTAAQQPRGDEGMRMAHGDKPRFGINSLINRMTGHGETGPGASPRQQPTMQHRAQASAPAPQDREDPDQERIEIPAFLRRQAN
jgi:cell division protein FtsZ